MAPWVRLGTYPEEVPQNVRHPPLRGPPCSARILGVEVRRYVPVRYLSFLRVQTTSDCTYRWPWPSRSLLLLPPPCGIAFTGDSPPARTPPFSRSHWSIPRLAPALRIRPPTTASLSTSTSPSPQPPVSLPPSYQSKHLLCSQHQTFTSRRYLLAPNRQRTQTTTHTLTTASIRISAFAALTSPHLTVASPPAIPQ